MTITWLIGASTGIGRALACELASRGHTLIVSARSGQKLDELKALIGNKCHAFSLDVCDKDSVTHAWEELTQTFTTIDTVIYCAGAYEVMSAENFKLDVAEQMINVNLTGALRVLKMVIPMLIQHQQGHIVLIGSIAGYRGLPNAIGYGASKAGLIHLAENLKCDLAQHNIKVQVINPGFVKTQLTDKNTFSMPFILSPEQAAKQIVTAMTNKSFESRFPFVFANGLKLLSKLPYWLYFYLIRKATGT